jgi:hypothetical protein
MIVLTLGEREILAWRRMLDSRGLTEWRVNDPALRWHRWAGMLNPDPKHRMGDWSAELPVKKTPPAEWLSAMSALAKGA